MPKTRRGTLILGAVAIAGVVGFMAYQRYALPAYRGAGAALAATEDALGAPGTLFLASLDVTYLRKLEAKLYGKANLPDQNADSTSSGSVLDALRRAVMSRSESLSYVSAAAAIGGDGALSLALVAGGDFEPDRVLKALQANAQVQPASQQENAWIVQVEDVDTCQPSKAWTVVLTKDRLIAVDHPESILLDRLQGAATPGRDLGPWRTFRKSRFAAAALFVPKELPQQGLDPFVGGAAQMAKQGLEDFDAIYLGGAAKNFPPGGNVALWMSARSPAVAAQKAAAWQAALASSRKDWESLMPTVAALHDHASIDARENLVRADITLDKALTQRLRQLPQELLGLMFAGFNLRMPEMPTAAAPAEELDKNPRQFAPQLSLAQIAPYDPKAMFAEPVDVASGPFGIQFMAARLTASDPRLLELEIKAIATNVPNVGEDAESAMALSITSVRDREGKELLLAERCGRERNSLAAHPVHSFSGVMNATKKVRLHEAARHADVATIQGMVRLRVPTRTETVALSKLKPGAHIERDHLRVEITQVEAGAVSYRVSGATERLLHMRARNAKGELLASGGSSSMGGGFGDARSVTREFRGKPTSVEFVVAASSETKDFPFELKSAWPQVQNAWALDKPPVYARYAKPELRRDLQQTFVLKRFQAPAASGQAGPAVVDLDGASAFRNLGLNFSLYLPALRNLEGALSAAELEIRELMLADGTLHRAPAVPGAWRISVPLSRGGDDYVSGRGEVATGIKTRSNAVRTISGRVWLRVPLEVGRSAWTVTEVGAQADSICGPLRVTEIARDGIALEGTGNPACLYALRALNAEGKDLRIGNTSVKTEPTGWRARFSINGIPNTLELVTVKKSERLELPFVLTAAPANAAAAQ